MISIYALMIFRSLYRSSQRPHNRARRNADGTTANAHESHGACRRVAEG
jgi:hypothetical protein